MFDDPRSQTLFMLEKNWKSIDFIIPITNFVDSLSSKFLKRQLGRDHGDLKLQIGKKSYNIKAFKRTGPVNLSDPKFIWPKAIVDRKNILI